jgi:hypothetical protein
MRTKSNHGLTRIKRRDNSMGQDADNIQMPAIVSQYARMWPRDVFNHKVPGPNGRTVLLSKTQELGILELPGVYILYRDDAPYYIGKAKRLHKRLFDHARRPGSKYDLFWNYFSVFVVEDDTQRSEVEAMLIAAIPTANGAKPSSPWCKS